GNVQPRIGVVYELTPKTLVRAGYGLFYDTIGVNRSAAIQTGFTATTPINASLDNGLTFVATTANPFPSGLQSPAGAGGGLTTNLGQSLTVYPVRRQQPYAQRWAIGVQRLLPGEFLIDLSYVGNRGDHLPVAREINALDPRYMSRSSERDQKAIDFLSEK